MITVSNRASSRAVLWEVLAPVVRWPLRSPMRFVGSIAAMCLAVLMISGGSEEPSQSGTDDAAATTAGREPAGAPLLGPVGVAPQQLPLPIGALEQAETPSDPLMDEPGDPVADDPGDPSTDEPGPAKAPSVATDRARAFMKAWANPDLSAKKWRAGVAPFADPVLAEGFAKTDPNNVPASKVNGIKPLEVTDQSIVYRVGTDAGDMRLVMTSDGITWWVSELTPGRDLTAPHSHDEDSHDDGVEG